MTDDTDRLEDFIHYHFGNVKLLTLALTHSSFANESAGELEDNERLEFLGDAVLELAISERLFRMFPEAREGQLTRMRARLVSKASLASVARRLGFDAHLRLGRGEEAQGGRTRNSLLSDALEAMLGAIFIDSGYERAREWVYEIFEGRWPVEADQIKVKDPKSRLQEVTQRLYKDRPIYVLEGSSGPEHAKIFAVALTLPTGVVVRASGCSLKKAEQKAAEEALRLVEGDG
ncbi:MAG: ribonuclease III [Desulfovibrionaceae bacterium]|jgi:ribonuclease-3|nr:ribonuclease III [Desulfovibrionaceae bacterium]